MKPVNTVVTIVLAALAVTIGTLAAWPIYQTPRLWVISAVTLAGVAAILWAGGRLKWGVLSVIAALLVAFVIAIVPLAMPQAFNGGLDTIPRALLDALAAVALGWKQLLTLSLPVGSYQTVLVPFFVIASVSVAGICALGLRGGRAAPFAAIPLFLPVVFGTVFGASEVSSPLVLGQFTLVAPREITLGIAAVVVGAAWVAWTSGASRRRALRRGRLSTEEGDERSGRSAHRRNTLVRASGAATALAAALILGLVLAPVATVNDRSVPRDQIDPEIVVQEQTSPLAAYREWKRDAAFETPVFAVESDGQLPERLRLAVLDGYDGVDFTASESASRFARFPSGLPVPEASDVSVTIESGYQDIWVPIAPPLADPPSFAGPRAGDLADSFYLNKETGAAVAVPTEQGLTVGDQFTVPMSVGANPTAIDQPLEGDSLIDLEAVPQLARWLDTQELSASGAGLTEAIERLRDRGYLSHSLTEQEGEREWITALTNDFNFQFISSPGGHSLARVEQLFEQLNEQERIAGDSAEADDLVAGIGDDEQFAAASAMIARALGFESRVVLGVRLGGEDAGVEGIPACATVCTGEHVAAWIEVRGANQEWVTLDVSPQVSVRPTTLEQNEQLPEHETVPEERDANESDPPVGTSDQDSGEAEEDEETALESFWHILRLVGLGLAVLALLALPLLFIPVAKRIRRGKRRAAEQPEIRVLGAWDELVDRNADRGVITAKLALSRHLSRREIAEALGSEHAERVVRVADQAVFSSESVSAESADAVWREVDETLRAQAATLGFWRRLKAAYSFASLRLSIRRVRRKS